MRRVGLLAVLLAGCWPYTATWRPAVTGKLVDPDGGAPIPDARIVACTRNLGLGEPKGAPCAFVGEAHTSPDGAFALPALERRDTLCLVGFDAEPRPETQLVACLDGGAAGLGPLPTGDAVPVRPQGPADARICTQKP